LFHHFLTTEVGLLFFLLITSLSARFDFVRVYITGLLLQTLLTQALRAKTASIPNCCLAGYKAFPLPAAVAFIISKTTTRSKISFQTLQGIAKIL